MTSLLSPLIHSPFAKSFHPNPYIAQHHLYQESEEEEEDSDDEIETPEPQLRFSPYVHVKSTSSLLSGLNDENRAPSSYYSAIDRRSISPSWSNRRTPTLDPKQLLDEAFEQTTAALAEDRDLERRHSIETDGLLMSHTTTDPLPDRDVNSASSNGELETTERLRNISLTLDALEGSRSSDAGKSLEATGSGEKDNSQFRHWADSFRRRRADQKRSPIPRNSFDTEFYDDMRPVTSNGYVFPRSDLTHFNRSSNNSSAFVETVKTASVSAVSVSVTGRSTRASRMSENRWHRSSRQSTSAGRVSSDIERRSYAAFLDEAAHRRAFKRRQVLDEILSSERGYVGDLKALANVWHPLLKSA